MQDDSKTEILCGECDAHGVEHYEVGPDAMVDHIRRDHDEYSDQEAKHYARVWTESSVARHEEMLKEYYKDRMIEADAFPNK